MSRLEEIKAKIFSQNLSQEEYLRLEYINSSRIRAYENNPEIFFGKTMDDVKSIMDQEPTPAMKFGTIIHKAILEPEEYVDMRDDLVKWMSSKSHEALIEPVLHNVRRNETFDNLVRNSNLYAEKTLIFGVDVTDTGAEKKKTVICKARVDLITKKGALIDIKTTRSRLSKSSVVRAINQYRYDLQLAFYKEAAIQNNIDIKSVGILFIEKIPPFENHLFFLDEDFQTRGELSEHPLRGYKPILKEMIFNPRKNRFEGRDMSVVGVDDGWSG